MYELDRKMGYWSVLALAIIGYLYALSYVAVVVLFPMKPWINIQTHIVEFTGAYKAFFTATQILAWLLSLAFLFVSVVIYRITTEHKKILSTIGLMFALVFLTLSSMHYYIQWAAVNRGIATGNLEGLSMFVQSNFDSPISALNVIGWTLFFGMADIFFAFCFDASRKGKNIKFGLLLNGIVSVLTALLFVINFKIIMLFWTMVMVATWYVYPVMLSYFKNEKE